MALFKICRGKEANLPSTLTNGYAYFCTDTTNFYIDHLNASDTLVRSKISANYADKLRYVKDGSTIEIDPSTIITDSNYETKIGTVTTSKNGLMSKADKIKLDGIAEGADKTLSKVFITDSRKKVFENATGNEYSELLAAYNNHQPIVVYEKLSTGDFIEYYFDYRGGSGTLYFIRSLLAQPDFFYHVSVGVKPDNSIEITLKKIEKASNKVSYITSSNKTNTVYYPSVNAVVDYFKFLQIDDDGNLTNIRIKDQINGYNYILCMRNGTLATTCAITSINITTNPTKMAYTAGDYIDTTGMVVSAACEDGTIREITEYTCDNYVTLDNPVFTITYTEGGVTYSTTLTVAVTAFNPAIVLIDFTYTDNGDGTYTITDWKETYNGEASTEMIVPNNAYIVL